MNQLDSRKSIVILVSGNGSNLQAIIDAMATKNTADGMTETVSAFIDAKAAKISAVISNVADAYALERAKKAGISTEIVNHQDFDSREAFDENLQSIIDKYNPDLVVLSGFMRLLTEPFVMHYYGRMLNIHPSLLPKYRGLNTHKRALESGDASHGASVHFVTPDLDSGPVVAQTVVDIVDDDTVDSLAERVLKEEHYIYPLVINWFVEGRLSMQGEDIIYDDEVLTAPIVFSADR